MQENEIDVIGENDPRKVDVRIIAATNRDLRQMAADGQFRQDLFYRLSVAPLHLPPLRERKEDIPLLVRSFAERICKRFGRPQSKYRQSHPSQTGNVRLARQRPGTGKCG